MLKLSQKKRKACLALAVAAAVLGANNAFAASVEPSTKVTIMVVPCARTGRNRGFMMLISILIPLMRI